MRDYPVLAGLGLGQQRLLDDCVEVLAVFSAFAEEIASQAARLDRAPAEDGAAILSSILGAACRHRLFSLVIPRTLGGAGCSMLALSVGLEYLAQVCTGVANLVATHGLALALVGATGSLRQLVRLAEAIVAGEQEQRPYLLATAATEPSAGSDIEDYEALGRAVFESYAEPDGDSYVLHGRKIYVSNGSLASAYVVLMPTDRKRPRDTLSAFLVLRTDTMPAIVRVEDKLGQRACPAAELHFDGCRVPREQVLGIGTVAGKTLDFVLGSSRSTVGAFGAGIAFGVYDTCRRIAAERRSYDSASFLTHPRTKALLAQMWSNAHAARSTYLSAAYVQARFGLVSLMSAEPLRSLDRILPRNLAGRRWTERLLGWSGIDREARRVLGQFDPRNVALASAHGSAAKVRTSELALANCALALDLLGFEATREDSGLPKYWRDARLLGIYEGTNEICALDVANQVVIGAS